MKNQSKKARFLIQEYLEYKGLYRCRTYKVRSRRVERRAAKQSLKNE